MCEKLPQPEEVMYSCVVLYRMVTFGGFLWFYPPKHKAFDVQLISSYGFLAH